MTEIIFKSILKQINMKKQLQEKLYTCLPLGMAFIVTAMMFSESANAQIVYMDVNPDSTMYCNAPVNPCNKNYNLDLNNDANNDFIIGSHAWNFMVSALLFDDGISVSPLNGNAVKDTLLGSDTVSIPLQLNAVIDGNLLLNQSWHTSGSNYMKDTMAYGSGPYYGHGLWNNLSDYYLGLRLLLSGQTYYGWVRLRVDVTLGHASVIIRDYAYNSIPDSAIFAGQTIATGIIENSFASSIHLFPNPATNNLTISLGSNNRKVEVTIADITGKIIYKTIARNAQKVEVNTEDFAAGVYVVQIQTPDFLETKRLVVEK